MISFCSPKQLAQALVSRLPIAVTVGGRDVNFVQVAPGSYEGSDGCLVARLSSEHDRQVNALWYQMRLENTGGEMVQDIRVSPLCLRFDLSRSQTQARVRYLTGSGHFDGCYPPRAFEEHERIFLAHDHCKQVIIGSDEGKDTPPGSSANHYAPMLQFAVGPEEHLSGLMVGFEWSGRWSISAGWENYSFQGEPQGYFLLKGEMEFDNIVMKPGETLTIPKVHLVFFDGNWSDLDNAQRRYIRECVARKGGGREHVNKVTYDHWFGLHSNFDSETMMRQAKAAAELGCEFFCLDGGWYGSGAFGASGTGKWDEPDPAKFPLLRLPAAEAAAEGGAIRALKHLSAYCRSLGMGFGLWHQIETRNGAGPDFDFAIPEQRDEALGVLRRWVKDYDLTWMRWEMCGTGGLRYLNGYYHILQTLNEEFPDLHIECCYGGGTRFDLGMIRYCTSTWLSDHTSNRHVCRFNQTGALRFWPSHLLNLAISVYPGTGDSEADPIALLCRLTGSPSFNGYIAQWSPEAIARMRLAVDVYKQVRHLQSQPAFFPLPQPRSMGEWDVVVFGDGEGEGQLLYAFRMEGPQTVEISIPPAPGQWRQLLGSGSGHLAGSAELVALTLPKYGAALWTR